MKLRHSVLIVHRNLNQHRLFKCSLPDSCTVGMYTINDYTQNKKLVTSYMGEGTSFLVWDPRFKNGFFLCELLLLLPFLLLGTFCSLRSQKRKARASHPEFCIKNALNWFEKQRRAQRESEVG